MDYAELKKKTAVQLREMAAEHDDITGVSSMKKDELLAALSKKLGIKPEKTKKKPPGKASMKKKIKELKVLRDKALEKKDHQTLKKVRRQIHRQKVLLRRKSA